MNYYLRCKYFDKAPMLVFDNEYVVTFKSYDNLCAKPVLDSGVWPPEGEQWVIVNRGDVLREKNGDGLVRLVGMKMKEDETGAEVSIYNFPDGRADCFNVPMEELVLK